MTLSNIFFGKKVVQQAYLNNALIYQSKGWETLPSTCTEAWTKELGIVNSDTVDQCLTDSNNNMYVLADSTIFKIDSEGTVLWSKTINGIQRIAVDINNDVYIALVDDEYSYAARLDSDGNVENKFKIAEFVLNEITNLVLDNNYLYVSGNYNNEINYYIFKFDKLGKLIMQRTLRLNKSTLAVDDSFLYAGLENQLIKIDKSNISNYTPVYITPSSYTVGNIVLDGLGNAIVIDTAGYVNKYNFENNLSTEYSERSTGPNYIATLDYQKNLYFTWAGLRDNIDNIIYLIKYSSDGTLIFDTQILKDKSNSIFYGKLSADNNGNIYYSYKKYNSTNYSLTVKKLINIEKKGN